MAIDRFNQSFTTKEAEFIAGFIFGYVVEHMGGLIADSGLNEEQEQECYKAMRQAFRWIDKKTSIELEMLADLEELTRDEAP